MVNSAHLEQYWKAALESHQRGNYLDAEKNYRHILEILPEHADTLHYLGLLKRDTGQLDEAVELLEKAINFAPDEVQLLSNLSALYLEKKQFKQSQNAAQKALQLGGNTLKLWQNLINSSIGLDDYQKAFQQLQQAQAIYPESPELAFPAGLIAIKQQHFEQANEQFSFCLSQDAENIQASFYYGLSLKYLGRDAEAISAFEQVLSVDPDNYDAFFNRNSVRKIQRVDEYILHFEKIFNHKCATPQQTDDSIGNVGFSLGKVYDDIGNYDKAFHYFSQANAMLSEDTSFNYIENEVNGNLAFNYSDILAQHSGVGIDSKKPIFIVGMPRSGTSLLEQILSSHHLIAAAGESPEIYNIANELKNRSGKLSSLAAIRQSDANLLSKMGQRYLNSCDAISPTANYISDKLPINYLYVGLIKIILPGATVINLQRHPLDICLSCYFQSFVDGFGYTNSLESLARVIKLYLRQMAYWQHHLPNQIHTIRYETLIAFRENVLEELVKKLGIEWESAMLSHENNQRVPITASHWQARQPIYKSSTFRWKNYQKYIGHLMDMLKQEVSEYEVQLAKDEEMYSVNV